MAHSENNEEHVFRSRYPREPVPEDVTLTEFVLRDAESCGNKVAFVEAGTGRAYTYSEVKRDTRRFAKALGCIGLRKGHVVVVVLPNVAEYGIIALGIMAAGGVFSGANPASLESEIRMQVQVADAKFIVSNDLSHEKVKNLKVPVITLSEESVETAVNWRQLLNAADRASDRGISDPVNGTDLCALPFSSGTTGVSKGVMLTHRNLVANLCSTLFGIKQESATHETVLGLIPFFHIYGLTGICCATLRNRGKVVLMNRFEIRDLMETMIAHEVTFAPIVPTIVLALVKNPAVSEFDLRNLKLRAIMTAAAPLAPELLAAFERMFPSVQVQQAYGLTEHSCITLTHGDPNREHGIAKKHSVGFILPNLEVKFIDPETGRSLPENKHGEICVRSQCVMKGYYKDEEESRKSIDQNGWLHTGDIGYIDDDGDVFIVDRIKELIKYKGFQVAPAELEAVLLSHPGVEDAAVVPVPDEEAGEIPAAFVVMRKGAGGCEEEIINYVASNVAHYKKLRKVRFVETIPKSTSGKIMRRMLKEKMLE